MEDGVIPTKTISPANIPGGSHGDAMVRGNNVLWRFALQKSVCVRLGREVWWEGKDGQKEQWALCNFSRGSGG